MKRLGVLTGGADCPGLNAVTRSIVFKANQLGYEVIGFRHGWKGLTGQPQFIPLDRHRVEEIHTQGGTILGTSRTNPFRKPDQPQQILDNLRQLNCDCLIAIGGKDTLTVAYKLYQLGLNVIGLPKTINNDVPATDYTFGFDSAVNIATEAIDRLHTTARSHNRVIIVEMMGQHTGWLALYAGIAGGAHIILIPEVPFDTDRVVQLVEKRKDDGKTHSLIAVAEGAVPADVDGLITKDETVDEFGHVRLGGIAERLAKIIEDRVGQETRTVVLGHLQRGGPPSYYDRYIGTMFGIKAVEAAEKKQFGIMINLQQGQISNTSLEKVTETLKSVPPELYEDAQLLFG